MDIEDIEALVHNNTGVALYFSGEDCGVCNALKPKIEELLEQKFPFIKRVFLDTKEHLEIAAWLSVFSVPTLIIFIESQEYIREGRSMSIYALDEKLTRIYGILER
jgi:thioredoxin-like negative regulator of GroEL